MKKVLALIISLIMIIPASFSLAADDVTLPVKFQRQMQHDGNGLKGTIRITAENVPPDRYPFLFAVQNAEYSLLRNMSGNQWHIVLFQNAENGEQISKTEFYQAEEGLFFRSDFIQDRVFALPDISSIMSSLTYSGSESTGNPAVTDILEKIISMKDAERNRWMPVIDKYAKKLEVWLAEYASEPEVQRNPDGSVQMNLIYVVPAEAVRKEIVSMITEAASDQEVTGLISSILTSEQKDIYMNPGYASYYNDALNSIRLNGELRFTKTVSALGEMIASEIVMPLDSTLTGYHTMTIRTRNGQTETMVKGDNGIILFDLPEEIPDILAQESYAFDVRFVQCSFSGEKNGTALKASVQKTYNATIDDESGKGHEIHHFVIRIERDTDHLPEGVTESDISSFEDILIETDLHFSGKSGPNASTTVEADVLFSQNDMNIHLGGTLKTAATWPFVPFGKESAVSVNNANEGVTTAAILEWLSNATERIIRIPDNGGSNE